ncbi:hypothetical protein [Leeuwenhoekiella marinoflava]|uniref:hypothetical protein n=1 Tax=Leeuwenhoekiella marinoflava TaxID=988 RepID=UPI0030030B6C
MKRTLFLVATSFVIGAAAHASEHVTAPEQNEINSLRNYMQPVVFIEQGIEFLIYPDGTLDFNATPASIRLNGNYVRQVYYNPRDVYGTGANYRKGYVKYNRNGQVAQIGGITIGYLHNGQVNRIGDIPINYKKGALDKVGNLKMHYDRSGRMYKQTGSIHKGNKYKKADVQINTGYSDRSRRS